jgi:transcriptional regulator with XRE-family HTH domain
VVRHSNQIDKSIGCRLRDKRTSLGWSQEQLAKRLKIDPKDVRAYEKGDKRINAELLLLISSLFGVRPVYFFDINLKKCQCPRDTPYLELSDQGFRLHKAFVQVNNTALREAIIALVIEIGEGTLTMC